MSDRQIGALVKDFDAHGIAGAQKAVRNGLSRRAALRRAGGLAAGLSVTLGQGHLAGAQEATSTGEGSAELTGERLYGTVAGPLAAQAKRAGLAIDADGVAFTMSGQNLVAMAPTVDSELGFSQPGPVALMYYSLTSIACADLANGYYTLELVRDNDLAPLGQPYPGKFEVAMQFVDLNGKVVAKRTFIRDVMREAVAPPTADEPASVGDVMRQDATAPIANDSASLDEVLMQDSPSQMGVMNIFVHRKRHYYVGPYVWWEWLYGGT
jgi:hypothetical protein